MIKAVIFDMDGLMFDTEGLFLKYGKISAEKLGYKVTEDILKQAIGTNQNIMSQILKENLDEKFDATKFYDMYQSMVSEHITQNKVIIKKGLYELLDYLKPNYLLAIASSSRTEKINLYLNSANIDKKFFDVIISGENIKYGKPNPDIYLKTIEKLNIKPKEALVLEDSNNGIKAASLAHCQTVLIPDICPITKETLKLASYKADNLLEVKEILNGRK